MTRPDEPLAEALAAAGYDDPIPAVGQVWHHRTVDYLPAGQRRLVRITSIGNTVSGWQCRVRAWIDPVEPEDPDRWGLLYLDTLVREYALVSWPERGE
jgi:hypothetical protein